MAVTISGSGSISGMGTVIQVVASTYAVQVNANASTVDTGLTATITPKSASSRIIATFSQPFVLEGGNFAGYYASDSYWSIMRGAVALTGEISIGDFIYAETGASATRGIVSYTIVDSPATTSPVVYKTTIKGQASCTAQMQPNGLVSHMVLMEISS